MRRALYLIFVLSGFAGLVYEVVWTRKLLLIFGSTSFAVGTVLAAFMGGLALGSRWIGARADRSADCLRLYARLEIAIGLYGLASPVLVAGVQAIYGALHAALQPGFALSVGLRFVLAAVFVLIPTTLMGGTLPVLARWVSGGDAGAISRIGILYAVNTAGAVVGTLVGGLFLLPTVGVNLSLAVAGLVNILAGLLAIALGQRAGVASPAPASAAPAPASAEAPLSAAVRWILPAILISGVASFAYEVAWTRTLNMIVGSSHDAVTVMLAAFLVGIAAGSAAIARRAERAADPAFLFLLLECGIGAAALWVPFLLGQLPYILISWHPVVSENRFLFSLFRFSLSFGAMIGPTLLIGATFPVAARLFLAGRPDVGGRLGRLYLWNTAGCILGALGATFLLIPLAGALWVTRIAALLNAGAGLLAYFGAPAGSRARGAGLAFAAAVPALLLVTPGWDRSAVTAGAWVYAHKFEGASRAQVERAFHDSRIIYDREGLDSVVTVSDCAVGRSIQVNGKTEASATPGQMAILVLLSEIPCQLHPNPQDVLVIGWGTGISVGSMTRHPNLRTIDVVELEAAVLGASDCFKDVNYDALHNPRVHVQVNDGRNYVALTDKQYDIILTDSPDCWITGPSHLFTVEHLQKVKTRLAPGGVLSQWTATGWMADIAVRSTLRTFHEVFRYVEVWQTNVPVEEVIVASDSPLVFDRARFLESLKQPTVRDNLERVGLANPVTFLACRVGDLPRPMWENAPVNTDDYPIIEFTPPLNLRRLGPNAAREWMLGNRGLAWEPVFSGVPDAERPAFLKALAVRLEQTGDLQAAYLIHEADVRRDPNALPSRLESARLLLDLGQFELALAQATEALRLRPEDPTANRLAALSHYRAGNLAAAIGSFDRAAALGPEPPAVRLVHAQCLLRLNRFAECRPMLEDCLKEAPADPDAWSALALCWEHAGDDRQALACAERALEHEKRPREREALNVLAARLRLRR